jgi:hypothetical protein
LAAAVLAADAVLAAAADLPPAVAVATGDTALAATRAEGTLATDAAARLVAPRGAFADEAQPLATVARLPTTATPPINIPNLRIARMADHASGRGRRSSADLGTTS